MPPEGVIDLDLRGSKAEVVERLALTSQESSRRRPESVGKSTAEVAATGSKPRGRGRPKLGVVSREVTLLPRHWDWLAAQGGGASAALRRLVDGARKGGSDHQERRKSQKATYQFMQTMAGDSAGFKEATRAHFADDRQKLVREMANRPEDVRTHVLRLADAATLS